MGDKDDMLGSVMDSSNHVVGTITTYPVSTRINNIRANDDWSDKTLLDPAEIWPRSNGRLASTRTLADELSSLLLSVVKPPALLPVTFLTRRGSEFRNPPLAPGNRTLLRSWTRRNHTYGKRDYFDPRSRRLICGPDQSENSEVLSTKLCDCGHASQTMKRIHLDNLLEPRAAQFRAEAVRAATRFADRIEGDEDNAAADRDSSLDAHLTGLNDDLRNAFDRFENAVRQVLEVQFDDLASEVLEIETSPYGRITVQLGEPNVSDFERDTWRSGQAVLRLRLHQGGPATCRSS